MRQKVSLSIKLTIIMILLVSGIIGLCWIINHLFLEDFYTHEKQETLLTGYKTIEDAYEDGSLSTEAFDITFENLCAYGNLNVLIVDAENRVVRASSPDTQALFRQLQDMIRELAMGDAFFKNHTQLIASGDQYYLFRQTDIRLQSDYLVLCGSLGDSSYVYMRTALESIRESAALTSRFLLGVSSVGLFIGVIVIFFIARNITRPIQALTDISRDMADLKFEVRYTPKEQDAAELAELGAHMNYMSHILEKTITDLKNANNELQQDIAKKEEIDELRKEFLSNVSHELKTPIALIQGYAEGLKDGISEDAESREYYCDVIVDEADKMNRMVKQLLSLNQLEFGNDTVEMTRFNISEMIQGLLQANQLLAEQSGITMEFDGTEEAYVWGDEFKVEEVLTNYISNAMHHADGEKHIRVYFEKRDRLLRICVSNTGNLIPEEELDKIWVKFYKVDKARTREYGGSGIGLSIVKAIMDSMHQACGVKNLTNGVEFWLELENGCITE